MKNTLYLAITKIKTLPTHPLESDHKFGYLFVWLYGGDAESVAQNATDIVELLPYELVGTKVDISKAEGYNHPEMVANAKIASQIGVSFQLHIVTSITDFDVFEAQPFPCFQ